MSTYPIPRGVHTSCESHPEWHFPPLGTYSPQYVEAAKNVCASCPFTDPCAEWAIRRERWGVWGGTTEDERQAIRRRCGIVPEEPDMARLIGPRPRPRVPADSDRAMTACRDCGRVLTRGSLSRHNKNVHRESA